MTFPSSLRFIIRYQGFFKLVKLAEGKKVTSIDQMKLVYNKNTPSIRILNKIIIIALKSLNW